MIEHSGSIASAKEFATMVPCLFGDARSDPIGKIFVGVDRMSFFQARQLERDRFQRWKDPQGIRGSLGRKCVSIDPHSSQLELYVV